MKNFNRGFAAPILLAFVVLIGVAIYLLGSQGVIKIPFIKEFPKLSQQNIQEPKLEIQYSYQNPFDEKAQYVNPFSQYHNPFDYVE